MPKQSRASNNKYSREAEPSFLKKLAASFSVYAFLITLAVGAAAMTGISFALIKTAPKPDYESWQYAEITIAKTMEQYEEDTHIDTADNKQHSDTHTGTGAQQEEQVAEYGKEHESKYQIDLSHDDSLYDFIDNSIQVPRRAGKRTVFKAYKTPLYDRLKNQSFKGIVSLVMVDYGLSDKISKLAKESFTDTHVTYAMSPYVTSHQDTIDAARVMGHEVWMTLPLQSANFPWVETGPATLLVRSKANENRRRLIWLMSLAKGFPGVINAEDSNYTYSESEMNIMFSALYEHGLAYATQSTAKKNLASSIAKSTKVPNISNELWLNRAARMDKLEANLEKLKNMALDRNDGRASIAFFYPYPKTIEHISKWIEKVKKENDIIFVPLSFNISEY